MFKRNWLLMLIVLLLVAFAGCQSSDDETPAESNESSEQSDSGDTDVTGDSDKGVLRVAINTQPPTLDPNITSADPTRDISLQIYEPLVTLNDSLQPEPMLAESYETSEDGKTITFKLREGVLFHNGKEMIAEDVVASMEKWQEYSSRAKAAFSDAKFVAEDDYTVKLEMPEPNRAALYILASPTQLPGIMPKEIVEAAGDDGVSEYIGTGPFKFDEWQQDQYIKLVKFEDYQPSSNPSTGLGGAKEVLVDEVYLMIVPDSSTRVAGVISGEYDIAEQIHHDNYNEVNANPEINAYVGPAGYNVLVFNKKEGVLSDIKLRQAVAAVLDMEEILLASHSSEDFYKLNPSLFIEEQEDWYSTAGEELYNEKNIEKAQQLMEEAGYDGEPIRLLTSREYEDYYNASLVIQEQLENAGFNVDLGVYDWATVTDMRNDPSAFEAFITAWSIQADPTQIIFLHSENEWTGWSDSPEIDRLVEEIRVAETQEEASALYDELQAEVWNYLPAIKFGDKNFFYAVSDRVEGFKDLMGMGKILWNVEKVE